MSLQQFLADCDQLQAWLNVQSAVHCHPPHEANCVHLQITMGLTLITIPLDNSMLGHCRVMAFPSAFLSSSVVSALAEGWVRAFGALRL